MLGSANYFYVGQVHPADRAIDAHATNRLCQWLCRNHKVRTGKYVRNPDEHPWNDRGPPRLKVRTRSLARAKG